MAHQLSNKPNPRFPFTHNALSIATPVKGVTIQSHETLPDDVKVIHTSVGDYTEYKQLPKVVWYDDCLYGKTGWNSDRMVAYYRTDSHVALSCKNNRRLARKLVDND
jgi:hypothetical protein